MERERKRESGFEKAFFFFKGVFMVPRLDADAASQGLLFFLLLPRVVVIFALGLVLVELRIERVLSQVLPVRQSSSGRGGRRRRGRGREGSSRRRERPRRRLPQRLEHRGTLRLQGPSSPSPLAAALASSLIDCRAAASTKEEEEEETEPFPPAAESAIAAPACFKKKTRPKLQIIPLSVILTRRSSWARP